MVEVYLKEQTDICLEIPADVAEKVVNLQAQIERDYWEMYVSLPHATLCLLDCNQCASKARLASIKFPTKGKPGNRLSRKLPGSKADYDMMLEYMVEQAEQFWRAGIDSSRLVDEFVRLKEFSNYHYLTREQIMVILKVGRSL